MEKIYFATTNEQKLKQTQLILADTFEIQGINIDSPENGITCEENAHQKLRAAIREIEDSTIIADDYSIEIEGITLGDICTTEMLNVLTQNIVIEIRQAAKLPFPGVFANRILRHFEEQELFQRILALGLDRSAHAKIALTIYQTRNRAINIICKSSDLRLQETITGNGWFWNRIHEDKYGISCTSEVWSTTNSPRAHALRELKRTLK